MRASHSDALPVEQENAAYHTYRLQAMCNHHHDPFRCTLPQGFQHPFLACVIHASCCLVQKQNGKQF